MSALPSIILYLIPTFASAALAIYASRRHTAEALPFSLLMTAVAIWSICHTFSVASPTTGWALFWAQAQYAGIVAVGPLWLWFALAYAHRWEQVPRLGLVLLGVPPLLAYVAVLTNQWHHLWWGSIQPDPTRPFVAIAVTRGPLFWLHTLYTYSGVVLGLGIFLQSMLASRLVYRNQARLVVIAALFPVLGNVAHLLGLQIRAIDDPTPFLFGATGLIMFYATRQYQLLDLTPVAQREVFEELPDGLLVLDQRSVIGTINPSAARLLEVQAASWIGRPAHELAQHSALASALYAIPQQTLAESTGTVSYHSGQGPRVVEARQRPINGNRKGAGTLILLRDITERSEMEQQLDRRLRELTLLNQIASAANAAAHTSDLLQTIASEIISTVGWDRVLVGILQPEGPVMRIAIDQSPRAIASQEGVLISAQQFPLIFDIVQAGETRILSSTDSALAGTRAAAAMHDFGLQTMLVVPLLQRQQPIGMLAVGYRQAQQITSGDLRLYETVGKLISDAVTRAQLYEAANEASTLKSAFLATVSHELRTPLTSIIGYADMLDQGVFGVLPGSIAEPLDHVRHNGQMLLRMINDILDFSKMEAGHFSVDMYPVDLPTVIRSVAGTMQPQMHARGLALVLQLQPDLPLVFGNSGRLEQVLTNLVANAIKFTEHGSITVETEGSADEVRCTVRDTGIGIEPGDLSQIFQPFHQIDNQLTRRFGGTGLGLAITKRLVELMGGTLEVASTPGEGSAFSFMLRASQIGLLEEISLAEG